MLSDPFYQIFFDSVIQWIKLFILIFVCLPAVGIILLQLISRSTSGWRYYLPSGILQQKTCAFLQLLLRYPFFLLDLLNKRSNFTRMGTYPTSNPVTSLGSI